MISYTDAGGQRHEVRCDVVAGCDGFHGISRGAYGPEVFHHARLAADGFTLNEGPILEKGVTGMRGFVAEPMRHGRLFLAGEAAHIVPPTGAKGMNLAIADMRVLAEAFTAFLAAGDESGIDAYSDTCLRRVWRAEHFAWWMTSMLHNAPDGDRFTRQLQLA